MSTYPCRFSGAFFPDKKQKLQKMLETLVSEADMGLYPEESSPQAIISAHAGYRFSGIYAAQSFLAVKEKPERVVVLSPSHRHSFSGIAYPSWTAFKTPLGNIPIERKALAFLKKSKLAQCLNAAHDNEHGIETQLPFIQHLWGRVPVVPLVIGDADDNEVAAVIDALDGYDKAKTLFVLSSDLSHFMNYEDARKKDWGTAGLIELGKANALESSRACGARAINGWLSSKIGGGTRALRLAMGNSAAVSNDRDKVVGYGSWAFYDIDKPMFNDVYRKKMLKFSRQLIAKKIETGNAQSVNVATFPTPLQGVGTSLGTLKLKGKLRGCIGSIQPCRSLISDVVEHAQKSAFSDGRFKPVTAKEFEGIEISISLLSSLQKMEFTTEKMLLRKIKRKKDGLVIVGEGKRGVFLPSVWESLPDSVSFLNGLKVKAGLPEDWWSKDVEVYRFRAEVFGE